MCCNCFCEQLRLSILFQTYHEIGVVAFILPRNDGRPCLQLARNDSRRIILQVCCKPSDQLRVVKSSTANSKQRAICKVKSTKCIGFFNGSPVPDGVGTSALTDRVSDIHIQEGEFGYNGEGMLLIWYIS